MRRLFGYFHQTATVEEIAIFQLWQFAAPTVYGCGQSVHIAKV